MMHAQDRVFRLALTPLAGMMAPCQNVFSHIPETELWPLLILLAFNVRVLDLLDVKLCHLNSDLTGRKQPVNKPYHPKMDIYFRLYGGSRPPFRLFSIEKSALGV